MTENIKHIVDLGVLAYGTPTKKQEEAVNAVNLHGGYVQAAAALGVDESTVREHVAKVKAKAALKGFSPDHGWKSPVPETHIAKGISTYVDGDGKVRGQWIKATLDDERREQMIREFVRAACEDVIGKSPYVKPPAVCDADLLACYPVGDQHHGMYAHADEAGANYDCKISSNSLESAIDHLATLAPAARTALLINLGDYFTANDSTNETPGHGNRLDVDTRYGQVMYSGAMTLVRCVLRLLEKHQEVIVWNMRGNHDPDAAFSLALAMSFYFSNEPRVTVDLGSSLYKYHRFGSNLIGSHHGHGAKGSDLPLIMAEDRKEDWGQTEFRTWHCGHVHHKSAKEYPGVIVETHRTLAPQDAWAAGKGYRARRDMNMIVYHRVFGEVLRSRFDMAMRAAA